MGYRIAPNESLGAAFRRIAGEQTDKALAELEASDRPTEWRVHQLRKRCKKIRALARLLRPGLADYGDFNRAYRDTARLVSSHRDARVMRALLREMAEQSGTGAPGRKAPLVRIFRLQCAIAEKLAEPALVEAKRRLAESNLMVERVRLQDADARVVCGGFEKTLTRAHAALRAVADEGTSSAYHEWRKRCKYHWYHLRLLQCLLPDELADRKDCFDRLGKLVGEAHDRSVLLDRVACLPAYLREASTTRRFATLALRQRREFRRRALELADGFFERPADEVADALGRYWQQQDWPAGRPGDPAVLSTRLSVA